MTDQPLTTGEGNTRSAAVQWLRMMNDDAPQMSTTKLRSGQVLAELEAAKAECGRLREQLNTRQWWLDMQYLLADRDRLREQLDAARQALEALWDAAEPYATYRDGDLNAALHAARAALGVEGEVPPED